MTTDVVRYRHAGRTAWGVTRAEGVIPIDGDFESTRDFVLEGLGRARAAAEGTGLLPHSEVELLCPITPDRQFLCQAVNYHSHMRESGMSPEGSPFNIFFRKASSCLAPATTDIVKPPHVEFLDYEVELGLVLSRDLRGPVEVTEQNLHEYVAALVLVNDVSARDIQLPEMQFYKGKSYRTFGPVGPHLTLVGAEELARFDELRLSLSVNGEERQNALTTDMVHRPAPTLTEFSRAPGSRGRRPAGDGHAGEAARSRPPRSRSRSLPRS